MKFKVVFQDVEGTIPQIVGCQIERFLCVQTRRKDGQLIPTAFWLKARGGDWHRFFIDRIHTLHWHVYPELDQSDVTDEDYPVLDIGALNKLHEIAIEGASIHQENPNKAALTIALSDHRVVEVIHSADDDFENEQSVLKIASMK